LKGEGVVPKGTFTGHPGLPERLKNQPVPNQDHVYEIELRSLIDFEQNRIRRELRQSVFNIDLGLFLPSNGVYVYDGSTSKRYFPKEFNKYQKDDNVPEVGIARNANTVPCDPVDYPIFLSHGIVGFTHVFSSSPGPERFVIPLDASRFTFLERGRHDERECAVLRFRPEQSSTAYEELWVDMGSKSAVLRLDVYQRGKLELTVDVDCKQDGIFPNRWTVTRFKSTKGEVESHERVNVLELLLDPKVTPEDFDIELNPGMVVRHGDYQERKNGFGLINLRVAPDGKSLVEMANDVSSGSGGWMIIGVLLLTFLVVAFFVLRRKGLLPSADWGWPRSK
jgi:hypothetical protein